MPEIIEEIPLADGGRLLIYDDGSQHRVQGAEITYSEGPMSRDRGTTWPEMMDAMRRMQPRQSVDPGNPEDLQWLRDQITSGNIFRESRPTRSTPPDQYLIVADHQGWGYAIGRRTQLTFAQQIAGRLGAAPVYDTDQYLWGVRGSEAARAAWRRDFARAHPGTSLITTTDTESALADTGIPPESVELFRGTGEFSLRDLPAALMLLSRAALQSQEPVRRYVDQMVARYNDDPLFGPIVGVIAGILEFGFRLLTDTIGLPASIQQLFQQAGEILAEIEQSVPDILVGLREAPMETTRIVLNAAVEAITTITGLGDIGDELSTGVELAQQGRSAESSLHIIRATGRVIELLLVVKALVSALRRIPSVVRRMRTGITQLNHSIARLRQLRRALREGGALAESADDIRPRRSRGGTTESERPRDTGSREPHEDGHSTSEADEAAASLPPAFPDIHRVMQRLLIAAEEGREITEADLRVAQALRDLIQRQRRSGAIPEALTSSFLEMERQIDVIEAVSHRRQLASRGAQMFAAGETPASIMVGEAGEEIARRTLLARGYRSVMAIINRANNGIDLIGVDRMGRVRVFEIKASRGGRAPTLSSAQREARTFVLSRLQQVSSRRGVYASASDATVATARQLLQQLERRRYVGGAIFEITHVFDTSRIRIRVKPWRGTVTPRGSGWWARLFRRMGLPTR